MKKYLLIFFLIAGIGYSVYSQETFEKFTPNGKSLILIFSNFHTDFSDNNTMSAFEIRRAYLGYEYNFSKNWYGKVILDVGDPESGKFQMTAFLKNAYFQYKKKDLTISFGLISTTQFKLSESVWGYRYIEKSFQDAYKFNSSADLGVNFDYKLTDFISIDFSLINGEGYKNLQSDDFLRPGIGTTINPVKNITARLFADLIGKEVKQKSLATFISYTNDKFVLGAEYNYQQNNQMINGQNIFGTSFFGSYIPSGNFKIYGRYDNLCSSVPENETEAWQIEKDGKLIIAGIEYSPVKGVKLAPNIRSWSPADEAMPVITSIYFNCELKF